MTNEEKMRIYLECNECKYAQVEGYCDVCVAKKTAQHAIERINLIIEKEKQQWIDKAVDFISKRFYIGINNHITSKENYYSLTELIRDFEQTMKGE